MRAIDRLRRPGAMPSLPPMALVERRPDDGDEMNGSMMQLPLLISSLLVHAERHHGEQEIVSRRVEGDIHRTTYRELAARSRRMANALAGLGIKSGERVATLAWNGHRHLELYYAVSGSGAVLHTLNPRLHPDQVVYIADHAEDQALFFDLTFLPLVEAIAHRVKTIKTFVAMTDRAHMPADEQDRRTCSATRSSSSREQRCLRLADASTRTRRPRSATPRARPATRRACSTATARRCCTPSRSPCPTRSTARPRDVILPVVPMFHVNAWGLPYAACMMGSKLVFPGPGLDGKSLYELFESERVTLSAGVPTVWQGLLGYVDANGLHVLDHAAHDHRRLGVPAGDDEDLPGALRRAGAARLGHDRDEPGRHGRGPEGIAGRARRAERASRSRPSRAAPSTAST